MKTMMAVTALLLATVQAEAAFDASGLVKVSKDTNPRCVTYYQYNNEAYCSTTPDKTKPVDPKIKDYETQGIVFDDRPWQAVWGKKSDSITTVEYVPAGDTIDNWQELVTSQFIPNAQNRFTAAEFMQLLIEQLKSMELAPVVTIIHSSPDEAVFEFRITSPDNLIQDELQKITRGANGIYVLHYAVKKADMGDATRKRWLQHLTNSTIPK